MRHRDRDAGARVPPYAQTWEGMGFAAPAQPLVARVLGHGRAAGPPAPSPVAKVGVGHR